MGGHSHMSTNLICLYYDPPYTNLTPNDPVFHCSPHTMIHFFFQNFDVKFQISKFCQFSAEKGKFSLKFDQIYTEWPPILTFSNQKRLTFLDSTPNDPLVSKKILHLKSYTRHFHIWVPHPRVLTFKCQFLAYLKINFLDTLKVCRIYWLALYLTIAQSESVLTI